MNTAVLERPALVAAPTKTRGSWIERFEWLAALLVTAFAVALHARFVSNVGALWRDETNTVNLATVPSVGEIWKFLDYDSFPVLYFFVLRIWTTIFGAGNDEALRILGLIIGLGVLGVLWSNARVLSARVPVLAIALLGLNPMFIRYGDSNRAYGLGIILILITLQTFWRLVEQPSAPAKKRIALAAICAVLSVQCLYYNSVLLFAIAAGAVAVALRARAWKTTFIILAIGALAAVTLLPYAPMMRRMQEWTFLVNFPCDFAWLWTRASEVTGSPLSITVWLWAGLFIVGLLLAAAAAIRKELPAPVLFAAIALLVGLVGYACFLRRLNYYTQPWYYITLAAFAAGTLDIVFGAWPSRSLRCLRPVIALALLCLAAKEAWKEMPIRHTNVDFVAARLQSLTSNGDLILVPRWECAIPLSRYYHGAAEIVTLPPIEDHRFHRYDLVLAQMQKPDAHQPVLSKIENVLRSGHRVFLAGELPFPAPEQGLPPLRPAFRDDKGEWHGSSNGALWQLHTGQFIRAHATSVGRVTVSIPDGAEVQDFENLNASMVQGWK